MSLSEPDCTSDTVKLSDARTYTLKYHEFDRGRQAQVCRPPTQIPQNSIALCNGISPISDILDKITSILFLQGSCILEKPREH